MALLNRFSKLVRPNSGQILHLRSIGGPTHLTLTSSGQVALAITTPPGILGRDRREFRGLTIELFPTASIRSRGKSKTTGLALIACHKQIDHYKFSLLCEDLTKRLAVVQSHVTYENLEKFVLEWRDLFQDLPKLSGPEQLGLWGELEVLLSIPSKDRALEIWHGPEFAKFDFSARGIRMEVKASTTDDLVRLQLDQLQEAGTGRTFLAVIRTSRNFSNGRTLDDQVQRARKRFGSSLEFERKLSLLGYQGNDPELVPYSLLNFRIYEGRRIPRPRQLDTGVSNVSYDADLNRTPSLPTAQIRALLRAIST